MKAGIAPPPYLAPLSASGDPQSYLRPHVRGNDQDGDLRPLPRLSRLSGRHFYTGKGGENTLFLSTLIGQDFKKR